MLQFLGIYVRIVPVPMRWTPNPVYWKWLVSFCNVKKNVTRYEKLHPLFSCTQKLQEWTRKTGLGDLFHFFSQGYEYVKTDSDICCGRCVQTHCVLNVNGTEKLLKVSWIISVGYAFTCSSLIAKSISVFWYLHVLLLFSKEKPGHHLGICVSITPVLRVVRL